MATAGNIVRHADTGKIARDAASGKILRYDAAGECAECCGGGGAEHTCCRRGDCCFSNLSVIQVNSWPTIIDGASFTSLEEQQADLINALVATDPDLSPGSVVVYDDASNEFTFTPLASDPAQDDCWPWPNDRAEYYAIGPASDSTLYPEGDNRHAAYLRATYDAGFGVWQIEAWVVNVPVDANDDATGAIGSGRYIASDIGTGTHNCCGVDNTEVDPSRGLGETLSHTIVDVVLSNNKCCDCEVSGSATCIASSKDYCPDDADMVCDQFTGNEADCDTAP